MLKKLDTQVILDPRFIVDLLSSVITTRHTFIKAGMLLHRDLDQIWYNHVRKIEGTGVMGRNFLKNCIPTS